MCGRRASPTRRFRTQGVRDRHRGPLQPQEHGVQRREHDGLAPLRRNAPVRGEQVQCAGDIQFGSGQPVASREFTDELKKLGIAISMDGRGKCHEQCQDGTVLVGA